MKVVKVRRENLWNRIFHKKELREQQAQRILAQRIIDAADQFLDKLHECNGLHGLLYIHRECWKAGFNNKNLGPNEHGMFRAKDIAEMKAEEVYLGDIYGMWTGNIPYWEKQKDKPYGFNNLGIMPDTTVYQLIVNQYKNLLVTNIKAIRKEKEELLKSLRI